MWLFTKSGFFSIKKDDKVPETWHVRARVKNDLQNLITEKALPDNPIQEDCLADYRYRVILDNRQDMVILFCHLAAGIDYPNFKNEMHSRPDQAGKSHALMDVWLTMARLQPGPRNDLDSF